MAEIKNIGHVAENVIALGAQFQSILDMADALKGMTSVEGAIAERKQALAKATADHEAALKDLKTVQEQTQATQTQLVATTKLAEKALSDKSAKVLSDAGEKAAAIVKKAQDEADSATSQAIAEAARVKTASDVAHNAAQTRLETSTTAAVELEDKLTAMRLEHDKLAKSMAALKSAAQRLAS